MNYKSIFILIISAVVSSGISLAQQQDNDNYLVWMTIAEKVEQCCLFWADNDILKVVISNSTFDNPIRNETNSGYSYKSGQAITIKCESVDNNFNNADIKIERFEKGQWSEVVKKSTNIDENQILLPDCFENEGLYRLLVTLKNDISDKIDIQLYLIIYNDWKKELLTFCRKIKEEIELNPDDQLVNSTLAISHFDNLMEIISESNILSAVILSSLSEAVRAKTDFENGHCPDFVIGLSKIRLRRFEGAEIAEFVIFIPDEYDGSNKWPLMLYPDPTRRGDDFNYTAGASSATRPFRTGLIEIWWHTSEVLKQYEWKDYLYFISILEKRLNIDKEKIYLFGWCNNSITAMTVALEHPDQWAECGFVMGNGSRNLAGNALNIPLIYVKNFYEEGNITGYFNFAVKCFLYKGCIDFTYKWREDIPEFTGRKEPILSRIHSPKRILYTVDSLHNPNAYWARIHGRVDENLTGTIDTHVSGQTVFVNTDNVDAYTLIINQAPLDINKPVEIIENKQSIGFVEGNVFTKKSDKYQNAAYIKNANLNGPVWDVFSDPYVVIWGSGGKNSKLSAENERVAKSLAKSGPCFSDADFPSELIESHNIVFVGTSETNSWLGKIAGQLPVQINSDGIIANGMKYNDSDMGCILVYPNPINSNKYAAVFSGTSMRAVTQILEAYFQMQSIRQADVGIFEVTDEGNIEWYIMEKYNTVWNWHDDWDISLANIKKQHPEWQWRQWFAKVIKEQLAVDVVICEDPFLYEYSELIGRITYRDIFNTFRNDWILKIEIKGADLRNILVTPFNDISKREVTNLIIEGVSLIKSVQDLSSISINDLENDKIYTIALPERCINGQRIGMELRDYQITGDYYVVTLLKEYFRQNESQDIDAHVDSIKPIIF